MSQSKASGTDIELQSKTKRRALSARHDPYYQLIHGGLHLGFRRAPDTGVETWTARARVRGEDGRPKYRFAALGPVTDDFDYREAQKAAIAKEQEWQEKGVPPSKKTRGVLGWTLEKVIREYVDAHKASKPNPDWASQMLMRANKHVFERDIGKKVYADLQASDITALQRELQQEGLSPASVNRSLVPLRAAINWLVTENPITHNPLQSVSRVPETKKTGRKKFPIEDCVAVVNDAPASLKPLLTCLLLTGCRPVAARRLLVKDVDLRQGRVHFKSLKGKSNLEFVQYYTSLTDEGAMFFESQIAGKESDQHVFVTENDKPWTERNLAKAFDRYRVDANLSEWESLYCFRHSVVTHVIRQGMPAAQAAEEYGTSLEYIQNNYFERDDALARQFAPTMNLPSGE